MRLAQEAYPLWQELEAGWGRALLDQPGTLDLGDWAGTPGCAGRVRRAVRGAGRGRDRATLPDPAGERRERALPARRRDRVRRPRAAGACWAQQPLRARTCASERGSSRSRTRARRSCSTALRAKAVVVTAGAWAPGLVGVDATPTRETRRTSLRRACAVGARHEPGETHHYALAAPGAGLKAGVHRSGPVTTRTSRASPMRRSRERAAAWVERRFRGAGSASRIETCLYTNTTERRVPARAERGGS